MTVKELNLLKRKMWDILMENPEISHKVKTCGKAIVYDVSDFHNHGIMIVNRREQINDNTISEKGFNTNDAVIKYLFTVGADHSVLFGRGS